MRDPSLAAKPAIHQAALLHGLAVALYNLGEFSEAKPHAVKAVKIYAAAGDEYLANQAITQATLDLRESGRAV